MAKNDIQQQESRQVGIPEFPLSFFACPNPDCAEFNHFAAGNLSICERMGKDKAVRFCRSFKIIFCGILPLKTEI